MKGLLWIEARLICAMRQNVDLDAAIARGQAADVRIGYWEKGAIPFFVNETILRRPVEDYVKIILG